MFHERDELEFKRQFAINFLSAWAADIYNNDSTGRRNERLKHSPVEDAQFLACAAWDHWVEVIGVDRADAPPPPTNPIQASCR